MGDNMEDAMEIVGDSDFGTDMEGVMDGAANANDGTPELDYPMDGDMSDVEDMLEYEEDEAGGATGGHDNTEEVAGDLEEDAGGARRNPVVVDLNEDDLGGEEEEAGGDYSAGAESAGLGSAPSTTAAAATAGGPASSSNPIPTSVPNAPNMDDATAHAKSISEAHIHMQQGSPQQKKDKLPNQLENEISAGLGAVAQAGDYALERETTQTTETQGAAAPRTRHLGRVEDLSSSGPSTAQSAPSTGDAVHALDNNAVDGASVAAGAASAAQAADVDLTGDDGVAHGVFAASGADGGGGLEHGPAADAGNAAGHGGAGPAAGAGGNAAETGLQQDAEGVPADVHDGGAATGASHAVHASHHDAEAGGHEQAAADSVAHESTTAAVHGANEPDARQADGAPDAAAGPADGARDHVPGQSDDAGVEPGAGQGAAGLRSQTDQRHEHPAPEDGELDGNDNPNGTPNGNPNSNGNDNSFVAEMEDLEDATTTSAAAASAADGGPGALAQGVTAEELPLDEAASEALQGHEEAAAAELEDNTAEYYDQSLDLDLSVPVLVHFAETGKTYLVSGEHADYPPLFEDVPGSELQEYSMEDIFGLMRRSLEGFCSMDEELVLTCAQLGLVLGEDNVCSKDATLMDLVRLFQTFAANTVDYQRPATFDMRLSLSQRFISNYNRLYSLAQQGHSLVDLSDLSKHVEQGSQEETAEIAGGGNLGKEILGSNSAALEDEAQVAQETSRKQEASLEFAKQAFSGSKPSEDPEDELDPVLETNYLPMKRGYGEDGEAGSVEGAEAKKAKEE